MLEAGLDALAAEMRRRNAREPWFLADPPAAAVSPTGCGTYGCEACPSSQPVLDARPVRATPGGIVGAALAAVARLGGAAKTVLGVRR
ncbi:hypothetical protein [Nocardia otitidiscaviarum]|uniref:hypothetical protein n=1 Tax=Nocardia otitidiscaviarum TaxID=1823 RepID=UPI0004A77B41|nr:hypothetical protein [Nocardia otitidiscaviarum]